MCTAVSDKGFFGRNLDIEQEYGEKILITPRNYRLKFRKTEELKTHYAIVGIGIDGEFPLYFDGANEKGLSMAGLNFPENAFYGEEKETALNVAPFEFIPFVLARCATVKEAEALLKKVNLTEISFSEKLPNTPLHFMIADKTESITVESVKEGLKVYKNEVGVLTNNPPFEMQMFNLNNYINLSREIPENRFNEKLNLKVYSRGMGALGLPGDLSSMSRFVKAAFTKLNTLQTAEEVSRFFHILYSVYQQKGCVHLGTGVYEYTAYSSCYNLERGFLYYTTYNNSRISMVDMHKANLESGSLMSFKMKEKDEFFEHGIFYG